MKEFLNKKIKELTEQRAALVAKSQTSEDIAEVRAIATQLEDINKDIEEMRAELAKIEDAEQRAKNEAQSVNANIVNGHVVATAQQRAEEPTETMEYRKAFMNYVQKGTPIPAELRGNAISTEESGAAIPVTVMREVINTVRKRYGSIYSRVRKTAIQGGVRVPVGALQATFKWIGEKTVSPRQSLDKLGAVTFEYHTAEIRIAQTFLSSIVTLEAFEQKVIEVIAVAYMQAMDNGIVNGSGDGAMLGIVNDTRVTNAVTFTAAQLGDWTAWRKNFFAKLPLGYRNGSFIFPVSTVDSYLETMADNNNNPIFRQATGLEVNDGDAVAPNGRFFGREVLLVEPDVIGDFDAASSNDVIGIYADLNEYAINENFGFTMRRYFDDETNEWVDKALVVVDGKVLNPNAFWVLKKA